VAVKLEELLTRIEDTDLRNELRQEIDRHGSPIEHVTVLVACGPNEVRVPCRLFRTWEGGTEFCLEHFELAPDIDRDWMGETDLYVAPKAERSQRRLDPDIVRLMFTGYYDGCGGVWGFYLKMVPFDTRFVGFDLD
jgi:hypothetical protein